MTFRNESAFHAEDAVETGTVLLNSAYKVYTGNLFPEDWHYRKITVYTENVLRIEVEQACPSTARNYPSNRQLQEEFGARYQFFAGKSISFIQEVKNQNESLSFLAPKFFRTKTGMKKNDVFRWYKINRKKKTVYVFAPESVSCAFNKEKIVPAEEVPEKIVLCEECAESIDEIGLLMQEIKDIKNIMETLVKQCTQYQTENKKLSSKLKRITDFLIEE